MDQETSPLARLKAELAGASPYPGLRPFQPGDSRFFRGRDQQIREIGVRLEEHGCVSVLGGSGSGKSSIIRAGVIPALRRKLIPGRGDLWRAAVFTPGLAPLDNLIDALDGTLCPMPDGGGRRTQIRELLYGPEGLGGFLPAFWREIASEPELSEQALERANLLVVVDQFEELFRAENLGKPQVARLVNLLMNYWRQQAAFPGLYLALTMRTDDLHRCAEFIDLPEFINASAYLTRRLTEAELREAIVAPVRPPLFRAGLLRGEAAPGTEDRRPYEVRLVKELLDSVAEIAHDPDHLPLLQHLLAVLWRAALERWKRAGVGEAGRDARAEVSLDDLATALGFADWQALEAKRDSLGTNLPRGYILRYCLEYVANQAYAGDLFGPALTERQRDIARTAFCLMGEVDDRGRCKRRWTTPEEIAQVSGLLAPTADIEAFVRRFTEDHRLLWKRDSGEMDVSHEALMRNWPDLVKWLSQDRDAASAFRRLDGCYLEYTGRWPKKWRWLAWFSRRQGLLRFESMESIAPRLAHKSHFGFSAKPLYHSHWTRRVLAQDEGEARGYARKPADHDEAARLQREYDQRFRYLRDSILRNRLLSVMSGFILLILLAVSVGVGREIANQQRQYTASILWSGLDNGWSPVVPKSFVDTLWKISTAKEDVRNEMVRQIPSPGSIRQLGFRAPPIVRAIGLKWPGEAKGEISRLWKDRLEAAEKDTQSNPWEVPNLACATAALADRLAPECKLRATEYFQNYLTSTARPGEAANLREVWGKGRILGCLSGAGLLDENVRQDAAAKMLAVVENVLKSPLPNDPYAVGSLSSAIAQSVWLLCPGPQNDRRETCEPSVSVLGGPAKLASFAESALAQAMLNLKPEETIAPLVARPMVSLIAAPAWDFEFQRKSLSMLIDWAKKRESIADTPDSTLDTYLIFAQSFEYVAAHQSDQVGSLLAQAAQHPTHRALPTQTQTPSVVPRLLLLRWALPLAEASGKHAEFAAMARSVEVDDCNATGRHPAAPVGASALENDIRAGLWGRLQPICLKAATPLSSEVIDETLQVAIEEIDRLNRRRSGIMEGPAGEHRANLQGPDRAGSSGAMNFVGEGLARAVEALAKVAKPAPETRQSALQSARVALASTGSVEEAAAWARAITALLADQPDGEFLEAIVEVLKYPNSGLTAREPSALEPQNPTDIFITALLNRPSLRALVQTQTPTDPRRPGYFRNILNDIHADRRYADIDLAEPPQDPRPKPDGKGGKRAGSPGDPKPQTAISKPLQAPTVR